MFSSEKEVYYTVIFVGVFALVLIATIVTTAILYFNRKKQNQREREQFQQELLRAQLEIKEQTLKNIGQEIHDNIGQTLSLAKLNLNTLGQHDISSGKVEQSRELIGKAIQDLRALSKVLNTDTLLQGGLQKAIAFELSLLERTGLYQTELTTIGSVYPLRSQEELILFRIVQESLSNIIKHAGATSIWVTMKYLPLMFSLQVRDNGHGLQQGEMDQEGGSGLKNMENRAALIGASFQVESSSQSGVCISITLPIKQNES
jgi:signal transduction histidine kinase